MNIYFKPRKGAKIVKRDKINGNNSPTVGIELKIRFDEEVFNGQCRDFLWALRSPIPFPENTGNKYF